MLALWMSKMQFCIGQSPRWREFYLPKKQANKEGKAQHGMLVFFVKIPNYEENAQQKSPSKNG